MCGVGGGGGGGGCGCGAGEAGGAAGGAGDAGGAFGALSHPALDSELFESSPVACFARFAPLASPLFSLFDFAAAGGSDLVE